VSEEESTTPDLVERARQTLDAGNRGDLDAVMTFYAPDAMWEVVGLGISLEGVAAIRSFMDDWISSYERFEIDVEEILDLGDGVTFAVLIQNGRPVGVQFRFAQVTTWADGLLVRTTGYQDIDEARVAAERLARERAGG